MKKFLQILKKDERGLTLVELLAVVVILAIIGGIAFVSVSNIIDNTKKDAHVENAIQVINSAELYEASRGDLTNAFEGEATSISASNLDTVGELPDPWEDEDEEQATYDFILEKDGDDIIITSEHSACDFEDQTKEELTANGRDICD